jgi:DHA1 family tetracycline resistance protein-like MFS transporter
MQFFFSPVLGSLSDRLGRRPVVLLSNLGLGLDYLMMALAPSLSWLFVGRIVSGITAASFSTAAAYIADVTPPEGRASRFGMLGAAFGLGFVVGPALGGLLGAHDLRWPFWGAAILSLLNFVYGLFVLPESLPPERRAPFAWKAANPLGALALLRSERVVLGLAVVVLFFFLAHEVLPSVFVLYTDYRYQWTPDDTGLALAAVGVSSTVVSGALVGRAVTRLGERGAALVGLVCGGAGFAIYALAPTGDLFLVGIPFIALQGLANPAITALMSKRLGADAQGRLQGALSSMRGVCGIVAPFLFTQTFAQAIQPGAAQLPGAPFLLAAAFMGAGVLVAARVTRAGAGLPT